MRILPVLLTTSKKFGYPMRVAQMPCTRDGVPEIVVLDRDHSDRRGAKIMIDVDDHNMRTSVSIHMYYDDVEKLKSAIAEFDKMIAKTVGAEVE